jgi:hypothetical protein
MRCVSRSVAPGKAAAPLLLLLPPGPVGAVGVASGGYPFITSRKLQRSSCVREQER